MKKDTEQKNIVPRPPVVVIMGHVDHGKSTLLDYIRKTNIVAGEAGGITQHISAYEVAYKGEDGKDHKITFLDTPGHAAFKDMRHRGAAVADIAILIVSAEEGVRAQTKEALATIRENNVPFVVAINKIDKPNANVEKIKNELVENEVYLEGYGGTISYIPISAKTGEGIPELLEMLTLLAELEEFKGTPSLPGEGFVIESNMDEKRGISATLVIKNGTISKGEYIVAEDAIASTRMLENFNGKSIPSATFSAPIIVRGFSSLPRVGSMFTTVANKREAENLAHTYAAKKKQEITESEQKRVREKAASPKTQEEESEETDSTVIIPIIIKSDVLGTAEAIEQEIAKLSTKDVVFKIIKKGVGTISTADLQLGISSPGTIVIGFNVDVDKTALDLNEAETLTIQTFSVIYKITEWLALEREKRRPEKNIEEIIGSAKILKIFSSKKNASVLGGRVENGEMILGKEARIVRGGRIIGRGSIDNLQAGKSNTKRVEAGSEFGMMLSSSEAPREGDLLEIITIKTI